MLSLVPAGGTGLLSPNAVLRKTLTRPAVYSSQPSTFANVTSADAFRLVRPAAQIVIENARTALSFTVLTSRRRDWGPTTDKSRRDVAGAHNPRRFLRTRASLHRRHQLNVGDGQMHALRVVRLRGSVAAVEVLHGRAQVRRWDGEVRVIGDVASGGGRGRRRARANAAIV